MSSNQELNENVGGEGHVANDANHGDGAPATTGNQRNQHLTVEDIESFIRNTAASATLPSPGHTRSSSHDVQQVIAASTPAGQSRRTSRRTGRRTGISNDDSASTTATSKKGYYVSVRRSARLAATTATARISEQYANNPVPENQGLQRLAQRRKARAARRQRGVKTPAKTPANVSAEAKDETEDDVENKADGMTEDKTQDNVEAEE
ncbi:hypothetical protein F4804DRAFT_331163 [Jackrogersella minutella]|nr:hypothetical protein F4804DRAFT_331163 [Jackrogersella minutella]